MATAYWGNAWGDAIGPVGDPQKTQQAQKRAVEGITNDKVELTWEKFKRVFPNADQIWYDNFKKYTEEGALNLLFRLAGFLAQVSVETGGLSRIEENLNYSAERLNIVFPKYFRTVAASTYARQPEKIANRVYANRMGNGSEESGDGWTYRGRGCIQLTGKYNYEAATRGGINCMGSNANYLLTKEGAVRSAVWFWGNKNLNAVADRGDFATVSRIINGGNNGWNERNTEYGRIIKILLDLNTNEIINTDPGDSASANQVTPVQPIDDRTMSLPTNSVKVIKEPILDGASVYPWNKSFESRSGHIIEVDDTPDRERMHWYHRTGTYTEFQPDGDRVDKANRIAYSFAAEKQSAVKGPFSASYGSWYTNTIGAESHISALVNYSCPGGFNVTASIARFSDVVDADQVIANFIRVRRGTKYGNVQDMKVREAEYSYVAGKLGYGGEIGGTYIGAKWVNSGEGGHTVGGIPGHEPTGIEEGAWGLGLDTEDILATTCGKGVTVATSGDLVDSVDGDIKSTNGGDRIEVTEGKREIASGDVLRLSSNTMVVVEAVAGMRVDVLVRRPVTQLPDRSLFQVDDIITVNMDKKLKNFINNGTIWEAI